jgi:polyisoprenoid-binding protein YceI
MSLAIPPGTYPIDTMHTQLGFSVIHLGISVIRGTFDRFGGELTVGESLDETSVTIDAEMSSINSGNGMRDEHVWTEEWLHISDHTHMVFRSTSITESESGYTLTVDLTIKGTTQPVTIETSYNGSQVFPIDGSTHHGFSATATISRSAFGVSFGVPAVSDDVQLQLEAQFIQAAPEPEPAA